MAVSAMNTGRPPPISRGDTESTPTQKKPWDKTAFKAGLVAGSVLVGLALYLFAPITVKTLLVITVISGAAALLLWNKVKDYCREKTGVFPPPSPRSLTPPSSPVRT